MIWLADEVPGYWRRRAQRQHLVDALVARGHEAVVLDSMRPGRIQHIEAHVASGSARFIQGDIRDASIPPETRRDVVYYLDAQPNVLGAISEPRYSFATNVEGTWNAQRREGCRGFGRCLTSSREVYREQTDLPVAKVAPLPAKNPYGASKVAGEASRRS